MNSNQDWKEFALLFAVILAILGAILVGTIAHHHRQVAPQTTRPAP